MSARSANAQSYQFSVSHRIEADEELLFGFQDPGRSVRLSPEGELLSEMNREIVVVRPPKDDFALQGLIAEARRATAGCFTNIDKANVLNKLIGDTLKENDPAANVRTIERIAGIPGGVGAHISIGQLIAAGTGVCRHRSILFKILADQLQLPAALVRGNYTRRGADSGGGGEGDFGGHAWNEVVLENGGRVVVDVMHNAILELSDPYLRDYTDVRGNYLYRDIPADNRMAAWLQGQLTDRQRRDLDSIRTIDWVSAKSPTGGRSAYAYLDRMADGVADRLRAALDELNLRHDNYQTSLGAEDGRRAVVRLQSGEVLKLRWLGIDIDEIGSPNAAEGAAEIQSSR